MKTLGITAHGVFASHLSIPMAVDGLIPPRTDPAKIGSTYGSYESYEHDKSNQKNRIQRFAQCEFTRSGHVAQSSRFHLLYWIPTNST